MADESSACRLCGGTGRLGDAECPERLCRLEALRNLVQMMREWQRAYFKTREQHALVQSKAAEARVDQLCRALAVP